MSEIDAKIAVEMVAVLQDGAELESTVYHDEERRDLSAWLAWAESRARARLGLPPIEPGEDRP